MNDIDSKNDHIRLMTFLGLMSLFLAFLIFGGILMTVAQLWVTTLFDGILARTWISRNFFFGGDLHPKYHPLLHAKFKYYRSLGPADKRLFRRRIKVFLNGRKFIGREGVAVTEEMKVLLAASAVKITFGLDHFVFSTFKRIFIYPEPFISTTTGNLHKGETHPAGAVVFSWQDYLHGIEDEGDNLNLGIHEFTHVFVLELAKGNIPDPVLRDYFLELKNVVFKPHVREEIMSRGYLREYGNENFMEFMSVCIESYFETPHEFSAALPAVYKHFSKMLNQDTHKLYSNSGVL